MMTSFNMMDWFGSRFAGKGMRLFCKSSSIMDKHTDMAVYLNARGIIPFMHAAMDATNNLADVRMDCNACAAYSLQIIMDLERMSAFVWGNL